MFTTAIVRLPAANFSEGLTTAGLGAPQFELALAQHAAYCAALVQCGLKLIKLQPDPEHPDSTFVEDTAILPERFNETSRTCAILTRPGAPSRQGEVMNVSAVLRDFFDPFQILAPGTLDGGDVCQAGKHFFIGLSARTNDAGAQQLAELLRPFGYTSSFVDIRAIDDLLHLKSGLTYLGDNRLAVTEALDGAALTDYEIVRVDSHEQYAANCVRTNDHVLIAAGYPAFAKKLHDLGYQTLELDMSEFQKMDGGLSCLSLRF